MRDINEPLIVCKCGHTVEHHTESFGTTCEFYRCQCKGWKLDEERSNREYLTLSGEDEA